MIKRNQSKQSAKHVNRRSESGNVFFTLFGAVAIVGVLGAGIMATMRGPLTTMVNVNRHTTAESQMSIAAKLAMLESATLGTADCEGTPDGYIEPLEHTAAAPNPTGGGQLPAVVGSTKIDPWGTEYGYCVWDAGPTVDDAGCGGVGQTRLAGSGLDDETYTVMAVISAGPDRIFQSTCADHPALITKLGDDIVEEYTYADARGATGGLWKIKSGTPDSAEIEKHIDLTATSAALGGSTPQLRLGAASMLFPTETDLATCNAANHSLLRVNTVTTPDALEICDFPTGWVSVAAGSSLSPWLPGSNDDLYYTSGTTPQVGIGNTNPTEALDVTGNVQLSGNALIGLNAQIAGDVAFTSSGSQIGWTSGADISQSTGDILLDANGGNIEVTVGADTLAVDGETTITGTTDGVTTIDALTVEDNLGADILVVQNDGNVGIGVTDPTEELDISGSITITDDYMLDGVSVLTDNDSGQTILLGKSAGSLTSGDYNTILGGGAAGTLVGGERNIVIGSGPAAPDVPAGGTNDYLNIGNTIYGNLASDFVGIGVPVPNDALDVAGDVDVTNDIDAGNDITAAATVQGVNVVATTRVTTDELYVQDTDNFIPATCAANNFNRWDGSAWVCSADTAGSGSGTQDLFDVLTNDPDGGGLNPVNLGGIAVGSSTLSAGAQTLEVDVTGDVGAINYCDDSGNNCFTASSITSGAAGLWTKGAGNDIFYSSGGTPRVGIGDTTPSELLSVGNGDLFTINTSGQVEIVNNGGTELKFQGAGVANVASYSTMYLLAGQGGPNIGDLHFGTDNTNSQMVLNSGNLGIGDGTPDSGTGGQLRLDVNGNAGADMFCDENGDNCFDPVAIAGGSAPGNNREIIFNSNGVFSTDTSFVFTSAGWMGIGTTTPEAVLDVAGTDAILFPRGDSTNRPAFPVNGMMRYNSVTNKYEAFQGGFWNDIVTTGGGGITFLDLNDTPVNYTSAALYLTRVNAAGNAIEFVSADSYNQNLEDVLGIGNDANTLTALNLGGIAVGSATLSAGAQTLEVDVTGDVGATNYCDDLGNDCFTAADVAGGTLGAPGNDREMIFNSGGVLGTDTNFVFTSTGHLGLGIATTPVDLHIHDTTNGAYQFITSDAVGEETQLWFGQDYDGTPNWAGIGQATDGSLRLTGGADLSAPHMSITDAGDVGIGTTTPEAVLDVAGTDAILFPRGVTGDRPTGVNGMMRYNSATNKFEAFQGGIWNDIVTTGGGGITFLDLNDTPANYTAAALYLTRVNAAGNAIEFVSANSYNQNLEDVLGIGNDANTRTALNLGGIAVGSATLSTGVETLELDVTGDVGAQNFCDEDGNNCFTAASVAGGSAPAPGSDREVVFNSNGVMHAESGFVFTSSNRLIVDSGNDSVYLSNANPASTGTRNTFLGKDVGTVNTSGDENTFVGWKSGEINTTGDYNTFLGNSTGRQNTIGNDNVFIGDDAGNLNSSGNQNIFVGGTSGFRNTTGSNSTALGFRALENFDAQTANDNNVAIGVQALQGVLGLSTGVNNTALGALAGDSITTGSDNILIGNGVDVPTAATSNYLSIGDVITGDMTTANLSINGTAALDLPAGTTAQRPTGDNGMLRYNSDNNRFEGFQNGSWQDILTDASLAAAPDRGVQFNSGNTLAAEANFTYTSAGDLIVGSSQLDDTGTGSEDSRMYFDKSNSAFRAGYVDGNQWNFASAGQYSAAFGLNTTASGNASTAIGINTTASGNESTAMGNTTTASGLASMAIGAGTTASGIYSTAMGTSVTAGNGVAASGQGDGSIAMGLIDDAVTITTPSQVTGIQSLGVFMGDQDGLVVSANNQMSLLGGRLMIDPNVPATELTTSTGVQQLEIDVEGDIGAINYCDEDGNNCFTAGSVATGVAPGVDREVIFNSNGVLETDTNFVFTSAGRLGIGTATPGAPLHVAGQSQLAGNISVGLLAGAPIDRIAINAVGAAGATAPTDYTAGMNLYAQLGANGAHTGQIVGLDVTAVPVTLTSIADVYGIKSQVNKGAGAGVITNAYDFYAENLSAGAGSITNAHGLYLEDITIGTGTNFSIYSAGGQSYFADPIGINSLTISSGAQQLELDVEGDIGAINYCDEDGNNCFTAAGVATGVAPGNDSEVIYNSGGVLYTSTGFVFTSAGHLGIGTATPAYELEVAGDIHATNLNLGNGERIQLIASPTTNYLEFNPSGGGGNVTLSATEALRFMADSNNNSSGGIVFYDKGSTNRALHLSNLNNEHTFYIDDVEYWKLTPTEVIMSGTGAVTVPRGDTGQRPTGDNGMLRYNSDNNRFEGFQNGTWQDILTDASLAAAPDRGVQFNSGGAMAAEATFTYTSVGNLGIGTATPTSTLHVEGTSLLNGDTSVVGQVNVTATALPGVNILTIGAATATTDKLAGIDILTFPSTTGAPHTGDIVGIDSVTQPSPVAGSVDNVFGIRSGINKLGAGGTVTNAYNFYASDPVPILGTITNAHGLYIEDITGGGTNNYAIYSAGGQSYFADPIGINSLTISSGVQDLELDVEGDIGAINYCDEDGNNCFTAAGVATGVAPGANREVIFNSNGVLHAEPSFTYTAGNRLVFSSNDNVFVTGGNDAASGEQNTAIGSTAMTSITSGSYNTAIGYRTLAANTANGANTAIGHDAMRFTDGGYSNTAIGYAAMENNTTGQRNAVSGYSVLANNTTGHENTAMGTWALNQNITGHGNTALGYQAGRYMQSTLTTGYNTALGFGALIGGDAGTPANNTGTNNIAIGYRAGNSITSGSDNILLGQDVDTPLATTSNYLNIGDVITGDMTTANLSINGTAALDLPAGTTGERPTGDNGMLRYNSDNNRFEGFQNGTWQDILTDASLAAAPDRGVQFNSGGAMAAESTFTYTSAGRLGIGTAAPSDTLHVAGTSRLGGNVGIGLVAPAALTTLDIFGAPFASSATDTPKGMSLNALITTFAAAHTGAVVGLDVNTNNTLLAGKTSDNVYGIISTGAVNGGGTVTDFHMLYGANPTAAGSAITNAYGLYLEDITTGGTNNYAIYSAGGQSYFADPIGINALTISSGVQDLELDVEGDIGAINYCDEDGNNCFTAGTVAAGGVFEDVSGTGAGPIRATSGAINYASADFVFGSPQLDDTTDTDHDNRIFFDKNLAAFRAGSTSFTQWDTANIGTNSTALGRNTTASGNYSVALGELTEASGRSTTATGFNSIASGQYSTALGAEATAGNGTASSGFGDYSMAIGLGNSSGVSSTQPRVTGGNSLGIFMSDQVNVDITASNLMALMGGRLIIDPDTTSATNTNVSTGVQQLELDVEGDIGAINYCDEDGNNCFTAAAASAGGVFEDVSGTGAGPIRATSGSVNYASADFVFGSSQLDDGASAHQRRMFFDKSKGAFRAGRSSITYWNDASIGDFSTAFGENSRASGDMSMAWGAATASGDQSTAWGTNTTSATGLRSTAWGDGSDATATRATAWGSGSQASGDTSTAFGSGASAIANNSIAMGYQVVAGSGPTNGERSLAIGVGNPSTATFPVVSADDSLGIFMGDQQAVDIATSNLMALMGGKLIIDPDTTSAANTVPSLALTVDVEGDIGAINYCDQNGLNCFTAATVAAGGVFEDVSGTGAGPIRSTSGSINYASADFVFGSPQLEDDNDADHEYRMYFDKSKGAFRAGRDSVGDWDDVNVGLNSVAFGENSRASGDESSALGDNTTASGTASTAMGRNSTASGYTSTAMGQGTTASGTRSTAMGHTTTASGAYSTTMGYQVTAGNGAGGSGFGDGSMAIGLIDDAVTITTPSQVTGIQSLGIFMGDQDGLVFSSSNTMGLFGGRLVIDPAVPATNLSASVGAQALELDVEGDIGAINFCDEDGNNCFTAAGVSGATVSTPDRGVQFNSGGAFAADSTFTYTSQGRLIVDSGNSSVYMSAVNPAATGADNVTMGFEAGLSLTSGRENVFIGRDAGRLVDNESENTYIGYKAGALATGTNFNTFIGNSAGGQMTTGDDNVFIGRNAGTRNETGSQNVVIGVAAGYGSTGNSDYSGNVVIGREAGNGLLNNANDNVIIGDRAAKLTLTTGTNNILIGKDVDTPLSATSNYLNIGNLLTGDLSTGVAYISSTAALDIPAGTTGERPTGDNGMLRYNSDTNKFEGFQGGVWTDIITAGGSAAAPDRGVQFNSGGTFYASSGLTYNSAGMLYLAQASPTAELLSLERAASPDATSDLFSVYDNGTSDKLFHISGSGRVGIASDAVSEAELTIGAIRGTNHNNGRRLNINVDTTAIGDSSDIAQISTKINATSSRFPMEISASDLQLITTPGPLASSATRMTIAGDGLITFNSSGAVVMPYGGTSERPVVASNGMFRYNSNTDKFEGYQGGVWTDIITAGGSAAAPDRGVQFNSGGAFTAESTFTYTSAGRLGVGTATPTALLDLNGLLTTAQTGIRGVFSLDATSTTDDLTGTSILFSPEIINGTTHTGVLTAESIVVNPLLSAAETASNLYGSRIVMIAAGSGNATNIYGSHVSMTKFNTGTVSNVYQYYAANPANTIGTIGTSYGLYIEDITGSTNNYAIYSEGGDNYFGGNVGIGTDTPTELLYVSGGNLHVENGNISYTGILTDTSDARLKTDITPLDAETIMTRLASIDAYSFRMKNDPNGALELGVIAQEVEKAFPELVVTADDEMGTKSVNYIGFIAPLIEATNALKQDNEDLRAEMKAERTEIMSAISALRESNETLVKEAHTGYGINKASMGSTAVIAVVSAFGTVLLVFFMGGALRRRRKK